MGEKGKYIYGVINSNKELFFDFCGIASHKKIYTIPYQDISIVVSDSEIVDYAQTDKNFLARQLVEHQKIIEEIMNLDYTIIPMRLGTFVYDENEVRNILNKGYDLSKDIFEKITDKIEIDVVAIWSDLNSVLKEIGEEKEISEFKEKILANPKGITVDDQIKVGMMVKNGLERKREKCFLEIKTILEGYSERIKIHELMDDTMVSNIAFLIDKPKLKEFEGRVEELNANFADKLNFRCVAPLPPYSFYTLEIKKIQYKDLDWARKKLGLLNGHTSKEEIKRAYYNSAFSSHPDRNPDRLGMKNEFEGVNRAYMILIDYSQSCQQAGQKEVYSFDEEEFKKNAIWVKSRN